MHDDASKLVAVSGDADLTKMSAVAIADGVRSGALSAVEVLEAHLARVTALNPRLNAVIFPTFDAARETARGIDEARVRGEPLGPLAGAPLTIKDSFHVLDTPSTIGIGSRRGKMATADAPVVARLKRAGGVIIGKTNVPQIMLMFETDNRAFGRTPHPESDERGSGGSSGGEAAAVAARFSSVGLGSDLLGSIRQPAHACGVHGYKPSIHRVSMVGTVNAIRGMEAIVSQPGPLARRMVDVTAVTRLLVEESYDDPFTSVEPWRDPAGVDLSKLRVGVWESDPMFTPAPAVRRVLRESADALRVAGADVVRFAPSDTEEGLRLCLGLLAAAGGVHARRMLDGERPTPGVARMLRVWGMSPKLRSALCYTLEAFKQPWRAKVVGWSRHCSVAEYWDLVQARKDYVRNCLSAWRAAGIDVLLAPPHGLPALRPGTSSDTITAAIFAFVPNLLGVPCGTVAASRVRDDEESDRAETNEHIAKTARFVERGSRGLPVGVQVAALPHRDDVCLAAMTALEAHFASRPDYPPASLAVLPHGAV